MREHAIRLANSGFPVFPVVPGEKLPLIKAWQSLATTDRRQVEAWWAQHPKANVGVHCADLVVLDVDTKHGGEIPEGLPETLKVQTPSGGWHLYYKHDGGVKNSVSTLRPGVDVRSNGGYVLGPGSVVDGKEYVIETKRQLAEAPDWVVKRAGYKAPAKTNGEDRFAHDQMLAIAFARKRLAEFEPAIEGAGGDAHTYKAACIVRDLGVEPDNVIEAMADWNARCEPPWDLDELKVKVLNAYQYAEGDAGDKFPVAEADEFELKEDDEPPPPRPSRLRNITHLDPQKILNPEYLVKGWLPKGSNALLFGEWSGGKTFSALNMGFHIAAGKDWFGMRVTQGGVLYVGYEGEGGMDARMAALNVMYEGLWNDGVPFAWLMMNRTLLSDEGRSELHDALTEFARLYGTLPSLVIIDPLRDALGGSDSDPDLTTPYIAFTRQLMKVCKGASVLTIHHPGHGDKERGRGDSGIEAAMDTVIRLDKERSIVHTRKQRDGKLREFSYRLTGVWLGVDQDGDDVESCVFEQLVVDRTASPEDLIDDEEH